MPGDAEDVVLRLVPQLRLLRLPGALEHLLRQRRAVVGEDGLGADGDELAFEAVLPQRLEGRQAGQ
jgi:hypothetical protein